MVFSLHVCLFVPYVHAVPVEVEESFRSLGSRVTHGCEALSECWESHPGPLEEQLNHRATFPVSNTTPDLFFNFSF